MSTFFVSSANSSVSIPNGPDTDPLLLDLKDAFVCLVENLIAGLLNCSGFHILASAYALLIIERNGGTDGQTEQKARQIPYAGLLGSEILFVHMLNVPDEAPKEWLRALLREHFNATSKSLVVILPVGLMEFLIADEMPEDIRQSMLQFWQERRDDLDSDESYRNWLQGLASVKGFTGQAHSGEYADAYTTILKAFVIAAAAQRVLAPHAIFAGLRKGQMAAAGSVDVYTGNAVSDAFNACRHFRVSSEEFAEVIDRYPTLFESIGWEHESVWDEDDE